MRYFLFALAGAIVASMWWANAFIHLETGSFLPGACILSAFLLMGLIIMAVIEEKL